MNYTATLKMFCVPGTTLIVALCLVFLRDKNASVFDGNPSEPFTLVWITSLVSKSLVRMHDFALYVENDVHEEQALQRENIWRRGDDANVFLNVLYPRGRNDSVIDGNLSKALTLAWMTSLVLKPLVRNIYQFVRKRRG